jgi:tRNA (cmo5U34)-methyltransferase
MEQEKNISRRKQKYLTVFIRTLIPYYEDVIILWCFALPFHEKKMIKVLDLGCGTGNISMILKEKIS